VICVNIGTQHVSVTLGRHLSNGQNYAIVCPNLTYLWRHSRTVLLLCCSVINSSVSMYCLLRVVYPMISRRRFQQLEVLEGQNILVTISGKKSKIRVYYLSWLKTKILKTDVVCSWLSLCARVSVNSLSLGRIAVNLPIHSPFFKIISRLSPGH